MAEKYVCSLPIGIRIRWVNSMKELLAHTSYHVCLICFFLALNLVKPRCLSLCLSCLLSNNYWAMQHRVSIFIQPSKVLSDGEIWVVINQIETLHTLSILIFACIYFCELKKIVFHKYLFFPNGNFEFINFNRIEKRIRKRQLSQGTCS